MLHSDGVIHEVPYLMRRERDGAGGVRAAMWL